VIAYISHYFENLNFVNDLTVMKFSSQVSSYSKSVKVDICVFPHDHPLPALSFSFECM
jgi:hypothetical protein